MSSLKENIYHTKIERSQDRYSEFIDRKNSVPREEKSFSRKIERYSYPIIAAVENFPKIRKQKREDININNADIDKGAEFPSLNDSNWKSLSNNSFWCFIDYVQQRTVLATADNCNIIGKDHVLKLLGKQYYITNGGFYCTTEYYEDTVTGLSPFDGLVTGSAVRRE